jgi:F-type H+-transporting ATPase subunit epsilon
MKVYIYAIDKTVYEGEAEIISVPTTEGEISVLKNHLPIITSLGKGNIKVKNGKDEKNFLIKGGFGRINQEQTILLVTQ